MSTESRYFDDIRSIIALSGIPANAKVVLIYLYDRQGGNGKSWPTFDTIQKDCSICRDSIKRSIERLEDAGLLEVDREHRNNRYIVKINSLKTRPVRKPDQSEKRTVTSPKTRPRPVRKPDSNDSKNDSKNVPKNKYGEFVLLTDSEFWKLVSSLGLEKTQEMIEALNNGIGSKGYKYKSHYHTILNWVRRSKKENQDGHGKSFSGTRGRITNFGQQQSSRGETVNV